MTTEPLEFGAKELAQVSKQLDGGLFINILFAQYNGNISVSRDYYTVKNGIVLMVNDGKEQVTGDTLLNIVSSCKRIGKYNPAKVYKRKIRHYKLMEFCKINKI